MGDEQEPHTTIVRSEYISPIAKAYFIGEDGGSKSNILTDQDKLKQSFDGVASLVPPYDPVVLCTIYENSSNLRPCVDAYITNVDSYGHVFVPVIDLTNKEQSDAEIKDALRIEAIEKRRTLKNVKLEDLVAVTEIAKAGPTDAQVEAKRKELEEAFRDEHAWLEMFFSNCTVDLPFSGPEGLRGLTRQDIEVMGYGYWEVLRDAAGEIQAFNRIPGKSVRLMPVDLEPTKTTIVKRISKLTTKDAEVQKRFRRYVQVEETTNRYAYFKEMGDPRTLSSKTGKYYNSVEEMQAADGEKDSPPATEIIPFKITSPKSCYGVPRWIGTLLAVMGTRQAEEVNFLYFENRSVPPLAITVSGGRLNADTVKRLESYISNEIRGKHNFHKILILEADGPSGPGYTEADAGRMKIQITPLTDSQQKDGLFGEYQEANADKVGQAFRLPRMLRGDVRDFNRSTAEAALDFAEIQVFGPIRQAFDWMVNHMLFPALGIKYHTFQSNAPTIRDPNNLAEILTSMVTANIITPGEARDIARDVFNKPLPKIDAAWTQQPISLSVAGRGVEDNLNTPQDEAARYGGVDDFNEAGGMSASGAGPTQQSLGVNAAKAARTAAALEKIHNALLIEERKAFDEMKKEAEVIKVPADLFNSFVVAE